MSARLILADRPGAWVDFTSGGVRLRARMDPMWLGHEDMCRLLDEPRLFWKLLDEPSRVKSMTAAIFRGIDRQLEDYFEAAGLSVFRFALAVKAVEDADLLEVDLLRVGVDIREWLDPEGDVSTRRVVALYLDFLDRPETLVGAKRYSVKPADKAALAVAMFHSGFLEKGTEHDFLKSPEDLERESEERRVAAEKRERMKGSRMTELQAPSGKSFESSKSESLKMLEAIKAQK